MEKIVAVIVGGGPAGLYLASRLKEANLPHLLIESSQEAGGQLTRLYPEKIVDDVPLFGPGIKSKEIVAKLLSRVDPSQIRLGEQVLSFEKDANGVLVHTSKETILAENVVLASGLGESVPRHLGLEGEESFPNHIFYDLQNPDAWSGRTVLVFGGGDSALDWSRNLVTRKADVSLIHRRNEFRGDPKTIEGLPIKLYLGYVPAALIIENGQFRGVRIQKVEGEETLDLHSEYVLVNFGRIPHINSFGLPMSTKGFGILANNETMQADKGIYVIGDALYSEHYRKRMAPAFAEADIAFNSILCEHAARKGGSHQ